MWMIHSENRSISIVSFFQPYSWVSSATAPFHHFHTAFWRSAEGQKDQEFVSNAEMLVSKMLHPLAVEYHSKQRMCLVLETLLEQLHLERLVGWVAVRHKLNHEFLCKAEYTL